VFASKCGGFALKLTADKLAYEFLAKLQSYPVPHLPYVHEIQGLVGALPDGTPLYLATMEKLFPLSDEQGLAKKLRREWLKALYKNTHIRAIPASAHVRFQSWPKLQKTFEFIEDFTAEGPACFDADTQSNLLFRKDGTPILFDPVWST